MRDRPKPIAPRPGRRRLLGSGALLAVAALAPLWFGCASSDWLGGGARDRTDEATLPLGEWRKDTLHCDARRCVNEYVVVVDEPGRLRAEVYAPIDTGGPDFAMALLDARGDELARPREADARPRRLAYGAAPGRYRVRIAGRGDDGGPLRYELVARLEPGAVEAPVRRVRPAVPVSPPRRDTPAPAPDAAADEAAADETTGTPIAAEVLDVEVESDGATFVLLDVGEPQGVARDMGGRLRDGDRTIGAFVIVEVYADGSRARIDGALDGEVGIDTVAEIRP